MTNAERAAEDVHTIVVALMPDQLKALTAIIQSAIDADGAELKEENRRLGQCEINMKFLLDEIESCWFLLPDAQNGTWQIRASYVKSGISKLVNEISSLMAQLQKAKELEQKAGDLLALVSDALPELIGYVKDDPNHPTWLNSSIKNIKSTLTELTAALTAYTESRSGSQDSDKASCGSPKAESEPQLGSVSAMEHKDSCVSENAENNTQTEETMTEDDQAALSLAYSEPRNPGEVIEGHDMEGPTREYSPMPPEKEFGICEHCGLPGTRMGHINCGPESRKPEGGEND